MAAMNPFKLKELGITAVLNLNATGKLFQTDGTSIDHKLMDLDDTTDFNIKEHFDEAHSFITKHIEKGGAVAVIC